MSCDQTQRTDSDHGSWHRSVDTHPRILYPLKGFTDDVNVGVVFSGRAEIGVHEAC
jgi:hypothetical protein